MPHTIYDNFVLENKLEDILTTKVDMNRFLTPDYSLTEAPGMVKKIHKYKATGQVDEVAQGYGNSHFIDVSFVEEEYRVGTTQGQFKYYDEQEMTDPMVVEVGVKGLGDTMTNDLTAKAIAEMKKTNNIIYGASFDYDDVVDAIAAYPFEDEAGLFMLINPAQKAAFRKNLKDDLKYVEANVRTGYIGTICGVDVITSKAVPAGSAFLGHAAAITAFIKKGSEVEQDRDPDLRLNKVIGRKVMLIALTDDRRMIKISSVASDPRTGYELLTEEPVDWATSYDDAYTFNAPEDKMEAVTGASAPEFVPNKYWVAES